MAQVINRLLLNRCIYPLSKNSKRFAGHSKWQNIRHIKEENDHEKMILFHHLKLQMTVAIQEKLQRDDLDLVGKLDFNASNKTKIISLRFFCTKILVISSSWGGSTKPNHNLKLSQIIERAKKVNMPAATIKSFLERMEARKNKTHTGLIEVRGPNGYVMLVHYTTDNPKLFTIELNSKLKKTKGKNIDTSAKNMFTHIGSIIVEKKGDLEQAMEDAINVGAEDVEEFKEDDTEYFQFKCDPKLLKKVQHLLGDLQYCVLSAEEDYIPQIVIELNESDSEAVSLIHKKVLSLEDVSHIYDNLA